MDVNTNLDNKKELPEVLHIIGASARRIFESYVWISLMDSKDKLNIEYLNGLPDSFKQEIIPNSALDGHNKINYGKYGISSVAHANIIYKSTYIGVLSIGHPKLHRFKSDDLFVLRSMADLSPPTITNGKLIHELNLAHKLNLDSLSWVVDLRDHKTVGHSTRVARMAVELGKALKLSSKQLANLEKGSKLHDIGKIGVPDEILTKPNSLTPGEWQVMMKHPELAYKILRSNPDLKPFSSIPYCHHEKWDGTGYPRGLKGEKIPHEARIFAIVDIWDAVRSERIYRTKNLTSVEALAHIKKISGTQLDPKIVDIFVREYENGRLPSFY